MSKELLSQFQNSIGRFNSRLIKKCEAEKNDLYNQVINETPFAINRSLSERLQIIKLNIKENPVCGNCGIPTAWRGKEDGKEPNFREYCGSKCMGIAKRGTPLIRDEVAAGIKRKKTMIEKYGVAYNSQREEIKPLIGAHNLNEEFKKEQSKRMKAFNTQIRYDLLEDKDYINNRLENGDSIKSICEDINIAEITMTMARARMGINLNTFKYTEIESIICDLLKNNNINYVRCERKLLDSKEIDIYLPEYKVGIECNGLYWHNENNINSTYHRDKYELAKEKGIYLFQFWEHEIINNIKLKIIEKMILNKCGLISKPHQNSVTIELTNNNETKLYITNNHIKGNLSSVDNYITLYSNETMSICGAISYNVKNNKIVIKRICCGNNVIEKSLDFIISNHSDINEIEFVSDSRFSDKDDLQEFGFIETDKKFPDYFYQNGIKVSSRFNSELNDDKSWAKVYDAGYEVMTLNLN